MGCGPDRLVSAKALRKVLGKRLKKQAGPVRLGYFPGTTDEDLLHELSQLEGRKPRSFERKQPHELLPAPAVA